MYLPGCSDRIHRSLPLAFGMLLLTMMLLLKTQAKTVVVYLDEKSLFIDNVRYLRRDIVSIKTYTYNMSEAARSIFAFN